MTAAGEVDVLAGELDLHAPSDAHEHAHVHSWTEYVGWAAGALLATFALIFLGRRLISRRNNTVGGVA